MGQIADSHGATQRAQRGVQAISSDESTGGSGAELRAVVLAAERFVEAIEARSIAAGWPPLSV
jgi:hypothetical protein